MGRIAPPRYKATAQSVLSTVFKGFGMGGAAYVGGQISDKYGLKVLFGVSAAFSAAASMQSLAMIAVVARRGAADHRQGRGMWRSPALLLLLLLLLLLDTLDDEAPSDGSVRLASSPVLSSSFFCSSVDV